MNFTFSSQLSLTLHWSALGYDFRDFPGCRTRLWWCVLFRAAVPREQWNSTGLSRAMVSPGAASPDAEPVDSWHSGKALLRGNHVVGSPWLQDCILRAVTWVCLKNESVIQLPSTRLNPSHACLYLLFPGPHNSQPLITFVALFLSALRAHSGLLGASLISGPFPLLAQLFALPSAGLEVISPEPWQGGIIRAPAGILFCLCNCSVIEKGSESGVTLPAEGHQGTESLLPTEFLKKFI